MISSLDLFSLFGFFYLCFGVFTLFVWAVMLLFYMDEIDQHFDSPEFLHRGIKGLWPWEMGRAASYGVFVIFHNSKFVKKKLPCARKDININEIPRKIKLMVVFPICTCIPAAFFVLAGGMLLYAQKWFF